MDIEKSLPLSEGFVEAESASPQGSGARRCLNCATPLSDQYCPHCGQKDLPPRQAFGDLLINFISSFWSFESKFLQTGKLILFKPGQLAVDYNAGKRERYFHPARMYVFISFVYFLLIGILSGVNDSVENQESSAEDDKKKSGWTADETKFGDYKTLAQYDSVQATLPEGERDGFFERRIHLRLIELNQRYTGRDRSFGADFGENFMTNVPRIFFVLLPIFALLLKLLYIRRNYFYSEHLVFSIYYYNFFFLAGTLFMLVDLIPVINIFAWVIGAWIMVYLLFGMKKMYRQSWGKTIFKYFTFIVLFSFCVAMGLAVNAVVTFLIL